MENQSRSEKKTQSKETVKVFVRLGVCFYLGLYLSYLLYLALLFTITPLSEYNSILSVFMFIIGAQFIIGPILIWIALGAYFVRLCDLSKVPKDTTLYECITSPTLQYGPLKVIIPVISEEYNENQVEKQDNS